MLFDGVEPVLAALVLRCKTKNQKPDPSDLRASSLELSSLTTTTKGKQQIPRGNLSSDASVDQDHDNLPTHVRSRTATSMPLPCIDDEGSYEQVRLSY